MGQRDICRASNRTGTRRREDPEVPAPGPSVLRGKIVVLLVRRMPQSVRGSRDRVAMATPLAGRSILCSAFQQNTALLRAIWRWWCQATSYRSKPPLLDVGLNEDEAGLAEVDMDNGRAVGTNGWEEVL